MRISRWWLVLLICGALACGLPGTAAAQWVLYDDFSSLLIDPDRWWGNDASGGAANPTTDLIRAIENGKLRLMVDQYGLATTDTGTSGGATRLNVVDPAPITAMRARVTVKAALVDGCAANASTLVRARAQLFGTFFNDGAGSGSDQTGNVRAGLQKILDTVLGNHIQAFVQHCDNAGCTVLTTVANPSFTTTWAVGEPHYLTVTWDDLNDQFVFSVEPKDLPREVIVVPYDPGPNVKAPIANAKLLTVNNSAANCNGSQKRAFMDATFDNVSVNP